MIRRLAATAVAFATGLLTACGVPPESEPRRVDAPRSPFASHGTSTPEPTDSGTTPEHLCFVREDMLVTVVRRLAADPSVETQLRHLFAGPTDAERSEKLTNPLSEGDISADVRLSGGEATVEFAPEVSTTGRTDEVLIYGQIVCTLTTRPDVSGVSFYQEGQRLGIPRYDGSLTQAPLTRADYADLIEEED